MQNYKLTNGQTLQIIHDNVPMNPRTEWDNLGTMVCFHNRYKLGDEKHGYNSKDYSSWTEMKKAIIKKEDVAVILPIYMYDHSGLTISTTPFNCQWDSGQIGFIFISKAKARKEFSKKRLSVQFIKKLEDYMFGEVETYDQYLTGDTYGFKLLDEQGEEVHSCWGFFGSDPKTNGILDHINAEIVSGEEVEKMNLNLDIY